MPRVGRLGNLVHVVSVLVGQGKVYVCAYALKMWSSGVLCPVCLMLCFKWAVSVHARMPHVLCALRRALTDHIAMCYGAAPVTNT